MKDEDVDGIGGLVLPTAVLPCSVKTNVVSQKCPLFNQRAIGPVTKIYSIYDWSNFLLIIMTV